MTTVNPDYLFFERLTLEHVKKFRDWGLHKSQLFQDYNFNFRDEKECREFLFVKTASPLNKYFAILYSEQIIGFISAKRINYLTKSSTLGIVLNPDLINMGYGSAALKKFLEYYFKKMKMRKIFLHVAGYNERARHVYEKMGFKEMAKFLEPYPNGKIDQNSEEYLKFKDEFVKKNEIFYNYVYKMELKREEFLDEVSN